MAVSFTILGSGSGGNCAYLETDQTRILIDAGFSGRQIRHRLASIDRLPESLHGILITHEHSDHIQGLLTLAGKLQIPVYCNRLTKEAIQRHVKTQFDCRIFSTGAAFDVGDIRVQSFAVPHDAYDPVGFYLESGQARIGFLTDLGHATKLVLDRIKLANVLILETNHDHKLLQDDSRRPWSVKQRILSRHGHLSNDAAADVLEQILSPDLQHVYLGHLSRDCNTPQLALNTVQDRLTKLQASHIQLISTSQSEICPTLTC